MSDNGLISKYMGIAEGVCLSSDGECFVGVFKLLIAGCL